MTSDKESLQDGCALTAPRESFVCPNCSKPIQIPYEVHGTWQVFSLKIICPECKKDISKPLFEALHVKGLKFKRSRFVGRAATEASSPGKPAIKTPAVAEREVCVPQKTATQAGSPENPIVEVGVLTFEEALKPLRYREKMFVLEYIKDFDGTRAATVAGYSRRTAKTIASENLTKPNLQRALAAFFNERRKLAVKTVDDIERV